MIHKIKINPKTLSYEIHLTSNIERSFFQLIKKLGDPNQIFVVVDSNVFKFHSQKIRDIFHKKKKETKYFIFNSSENRKSLSSVHTIQRKFSEHNLSKDALLVAIGGGITGDIAGFAASTYLRGIPLIHIPTTITSMVDSAIGGKCGVNFLNVKNMIGSIYHPKAVVIDTEFLNTLPKSEIRSGLGEVIKYGYLSNDKLYNYLIQNLKKLFLLSTTELNHVIKECIRIKSAVVEADEKDESARKILNFGHTFGHAIESASGFKVKHGEAVVAGIVSALYLSFKLGLLNKQRLNDLLKLPNKFGISKKLPGLDQSRIIGFMKKDKKVRKGKMNFILIRDIGELLLDMNANKSQIIEALKLMKKSV